MMYQFTRTYETYYDCYVEADSLEEAIDILNNDDDLEWEQSCDAQGEPLQAHSKTTWALLNEDGEEVEEGDIQEWNGRAFIG